MGKSTHYICLIDHLSLLSYRSPSLYLPCNLFLKNLVVCGVFFTVCILLLPFSWYYLKCSLNVLLFYFFFLYKLIVKSRVLIYTDSDFLQEHFIGILCISTKEHYTCFSFSLSISLYFSFLLTIVAYCLDSLFPWGIMKPWHFNFVIPSSCFYKEKISLSYSFYKKVRLNG